MNSDDQRVMSPRIPFSFESDLDLAQLFIGKHIPFFSSPTETSTSADSRGNGALLKSGRSFDRASPEWHDVQMKARRRITECLYKVPADLNCLIRRKIGFDVKARF